MRALVTGACGFAGDHLCRHLISQGDQVLGTVFRAELVDTRPYATEWIDVTNAASVAALVKRFSPEYIYHLAGMAFVPEAEEDFGKTLQVNVNSVFNIARAAHLLDKNIKVLYVSSAEVYGRITAAELPIHEQIAVRPKNAYSLSKLMGEEALLRFVREGRIQGVIMRPFNHIGPGQNERFVASSFARQIALIKKGKATPIMSVGNLTPRRDFTDVRDVVRAYRLAAIKGSGVYNVAQGRSIPVEAILTTLIRVAGVSVDVQMDPARARPSEVPEIVGSARKAADELGWHPEIALEQSLRDILSWWENQL